jgi:GntR family transcriptional repressor for pyruvate dehydrogenase complex
MKIVKIEKKNLVDEVYAQMYNMILSGTWQEGEKLPSESLLANQFNVSRVVVREALQILRTQKYIITRHGSGSYISNPHNYLLSEDNGNSSIRLKEVDFQQLVEFRNCIEVRSLELAAIHATESDFDRIRSALQGMGNSMDSLLNYSEADFQFHYSLVLASHNVFFVQAMNGCREKILSCFCELNKLKDCRPWGYQSHAKVAQYLFERNAKAAVAALQNIGEYNELRYADFFIKEV